MLLRSVLIGLCLGLALAMKIEDDLINWLFAAPISYMTDPMVNEVAGWIVSSSGLVQIVESLLALLVVVVSICACICLWGGVESTVVGCRRLIGVHARHECQVSSARSTNHSL